MLMSGLRSRISRVARESGISVLLFEGKVKVKGTRELRASGGASGEGLAPRGSVVS